MAVIKISPIRANTHLQNALDYITDNEKTEYGRYLDSFRCGVYNAKDDFALVKNMAREVHYSADSGRNEIQAWHITQSFSPEDNITPEKALELGMEFMKLKYPNYQYVIATHVDKGHIHNHIILNSVDFAKHRKLHTNIKNYYEMREVSDDICRRNNLSVIEKDSKSKTMQLKTDIDENIEKADSYNDFIGLMEDKGYIIKFTRDGKYISFKSSDMKRFIRSTSISMDYSIQAIKTRIETSKLDKKIKEPKKYRTVYDNKIKYSSKRKRLKAEIDNSIKKCNTFEEFKKDMERKEYEVKDQFKHLAFRGKDGNRFIRSESIGFNYQEDVIRYRLEYKEEYKKMEEQIIPKVYDRKATGVDGGLYEWMSGENSNIINYMRRFLDRNGLDTSNGIGDFYFYEFMQRYHLEEEKILSTEEKIKNYNKEISKCIKVEKAIKEYLSSKTIINQYDELLRTKYDELSQMEIETFQNKIDKFNESINIINTARNEMGKNGVLSLNYLNDIKQKLLIDKRKLLKECTKLKIEFQNWENIKYNFEYEYNLSEEKSIKAIEEYQEKQKKKEERKDKIKSFFKLNR